jgi:DNA-binding PadR family transcriptional regulator
MGEGDPKETLGELEELVLLAALRVGDRAYGSSIVEELKRTAHRRVARASVYVLLRRMEQAALIRTRRESPEEATGRPRRFVTVTPAGLSLLRRSRRARLQMWQGIETLLERG